MIHLTSDITVSVIDAIGSDQHVIGAMKVLSAVPFPDPSDCGRIRYLMQHRHGTPFEHGCIICVVHAPIFVWREWMRHRVAFSYNEQSARYTQLEPVFFVPDRNRPMIKTPDQWRASRPQFLTLDEAAAIGLIDDADAFHREICQDMERGYRDEYERYQRQLARDLDPGLARDNLPVGIYSTCWVTCNLRSALAFLSLRTHDPAARHVSYPLWEIQQGAKQLEAIVKERWPLCHEAFCDFGRVGP